jgi:hypothetical protein
MNAQEQKRDVAITALIDAGKITEDDAYPSNDIDECYAAQDALIAQHAPNNRVPDMIVFGFSIATCTDDEFVKVRNMIVWDCSWSLLARVEAYRAKTANN